MFIICSMGFFLDCLFVCKRCFCLFEIAALYKGFFWQTGAGYFYLLFGFVVFLFGFLRDIVVLRDISMIFPSFILLEFHTNGKTLNKLVRISHLLGSHKQHNPSK